MSLADIVTHRDVQSWSELLTLPALVLAALSRSGRRLALRQENETRCRCLDWINGIRADLWAAVSWTLGKPNLV